MWKVLEGDDIEREESMPTEREWLIMEVIWDSADGITSSEILDKIQKDDDMTARTERVLLHHLCKKGLVGYTVDEHDSRVYHYFAKRIREECLALKRKEFVNTYYRGNEARALASFIQGITLTDEQIKELEEILEQGRSQGQDESPGERGSHD